MSSAFEPDHPDEIHCPDWHYEANRPIVDGKYNDPKTGELRALDGSVFSGPPAVDIVVMSIREITVDCCFRAQQPFAVEKLLAHIVKIINAQNLELDSLSVTKYAIRVILAHELSKEEFNKVSMEMALGMWSTAIV